MVVTCNSRVAISHFGALFVVFCLLSPWVLFSPTSTNLQVLFGQSTQLAAFRTILQVLSQPCPTLPLLFWPGGQAKRLALLLMSEVLPVVGWSPQRATAPLPGSISDPLPVCRGRNSLWHDHQLANARESRVVRLWPSPWRKAIALLLCPLKREIVCSSLVYRAETLLPSRCPSSDQRQAVSL